VLKCCCSNAAIRAARDLVDVNYRNVEFAVVSIGVGGRDRIADRRFSKLSRTRRGHRPHPIRRRLLSRPSRRLARTDCRRAALLAP